MPSNDWKTYPNIVIVVWFFICNGFLEPFMLIRGLIGNEINDQLHALLMNSSQKCFEVFQGAIFGINCLIVGNVKPIILVRALEHGRQVDWSNSKMRQVVQFRFNAFQVANSVAIRIFERFHENFINRFLLPPLLGSGARAFLRIDDNDWKSSSWI